MNLVDALGGCEATHAVCTTYPFEPLFFGNYAIDPLQESGVATPVVLMDHRQYDKLARQRQLTSRAIGQYYYLEPVAVESTFHPKVAFLAGDDACHVSVSSANLTLAEYTTAAQLGQTVTIPADPDADDPPSSRALAVAQDVREFIAHLGHRHVSGRDAQTELQQAVQETAWLDDRSPEPAPGGFVHNLDTPILEQVLNQLPAVDRTTFFAPFFGSETTLREIHKHIDAAEYEILVADGSTHLDPAAAVNAFDGDVTFRALTHDTARWIHAKAIVFHGEWGTATLYGSPNVTGKALLETAATGNLEAGVLHYDSNDTTDLWDQNAFPAHPGPVRESNAFEFADYSFSSDSTTSPALTLADARVERSADDEVVVRFIAPGIDSGTTVTVNALTDDMTDIVWTTDADEDVDGCAVRLPESWAESIVRLSVPNIGDSNYRQITTEPTAGSRRVGDVLRNDGRDTVQSLVDETLFLGVDIAPSVITEAVSRLSDKYDKRDEAPPEDDDRDTATATGTDNPGFATGVHSVSTTNRKPHLSVKDAMDYAESRIETILENPPTVVSAEELLDHFENLWYYSIRGLVRSAIAPQLEVSDETDVPVETTLNVGRLHSVCTSRIATMLEARYFAQISTYIDQIQSLHPDSTAEALSTTKLADSFVSYPAMVLTLMNWHDEAFVERFEFIRQYHTALTEANPLVGEFLINGITITERVTEHEQRLAEQVSAFGEQIERDIPLPGPFTPGLEILLYGFWFRELAATRDVALFDNENIFDQYDPAELAEMAQIALRGQTRVETDEIYDSLTKGRFDPIVRLTDGRRDPEPQLQSLLGAAND